MPEFPAQTPVHLDLNGWYIIDDTSNLGIIYDYYDNSYQYVSLSLDETFSVDRDYLESEVTFVGRTNLQKEFDSLNARYGAPIGKPSTIVPF